MTKRERDWEYNIFKFKLLYVVQVIDLMLEVVRIYIRWYGKKVITAVAQITQNGTLSLSFYYNTTKSGLIFNDGHILGRI